MACPHLKPPRSLSGRSLHLTLVTKRSQVTLLAQQPIALLPFHVTSVCLAIPELQQFKNLPWKSKVKVMTKVKLDGHIWDLEFNWYVCLSFCDNWTIVCWDTRKFHISHLKFKVKAMGKVLMTWWSHLRPRVQPICLFFISWQSDYFWLRYSKFHIWLWPWKFKVKVMAKVKPNGPIWDLEFNHYSWSSFRGNRTIFASRYSKFHIWTFLKIQGQGHDKNRPKYNQVIYRMGPSILLR